MTEHERIWLEPSPGVHIEGRLWCQDNQWGEEGVEYVLASTLESLQRENEALREENGNLLDENSDLKNEPWPEWAKAVLKVVRSHTGYDGYDDVTEGVDMPLELEEHLSELQSVNDRLQDRAYAAEAEVKHYRAALYEIATNDEYRILTAEEAQTVAQKALASTGGEHHAE